MKNRFHFKTVPPALLALCLLSFGLLIPWLGFYWDDWPMILTVRSQGLSAFWDFYQNERPLSAWTLYITAPFLGTNPFAWHLFTLLLRWLVTIGMWWTLSGLWPGRRREVSWMALLFAVYPVFTQQPVAVAFSQHWITYGLYFLSLGAMTQAIRTPGRFWLFTILGLAAAAVHMFTMEYFLGLELLRPAILWLALADPYPPARRRLRQAFIRWLPYLLILGAVIAWRLFFFKIEGDPNQPDLLYLLASQPLQGLLRLFQIGLQDLIHNLIGAWYQAVDPQGIDLNDRAVLLSLALALATAVLAVFYLLRLPPDENGRLQSPSPWVRQAISLGLLGALLGPLPVWLTDRQAIIGLYSGRFALAAMFGLSILLVGLLEWFSPRQLPKILLIGALLGAATGYHFRNATGYYRSWLQQNAFYWQLYWRAPYIQPGTALLSADELFIYVGRASTAMAANLLYPQPAGDRQLDYWFLELYHDVGPKATERLPRGRQLNPQFRIYTFNASSLDSLVIFYKTAVGRCLWVLSPEDADNPELPDLTRVALPVSNLSRIEARPPQSGYPPVEIFGKEPAHTWCYYFQKVSLARQGEDWESVVQLGEEARSKGYSPGNANEWLPFIEGYAYTGRWVEAQELALAAFEMNEAIAPRLCRLWARIEGEAGQPLEARENLSSMREQLQCEPAEP